jgi:hypothetical protein
MLDQKTMLFGLKGQNFCSRQEGFGATSKVD